MVESSIQMLGLLVSADAESGGLLGSIVQWMTDTVESMGYPGIFLFMTMESMIFPIPSEVVMPPAGISMHQCADIPSTCTYTWVGILIASSAGTMVGSWLSYIMGRTGGRPFVRKWGRWFLLNESHLDRVEKIYAKWGAVMVFVCRFIPVVRHVSSIPAGTAKMNIWTFSLMTLLGGTAWNMFLAWITFKVYDPELIAKYTHLGTYIVVAVIGLAVLYYVYKIVKAIRGPKPATESGPDTSTDAP